MAAARAAAEARVRQLMETYQPEKMAAVPAMLAKYEGREQELVIALEKRFGLGGGGSPPGSPRGGADGSQNPYTGRVTRFYAKYAPEKVNDVERLLTKYAGKEEAMLQELVRRYGPEPEVAAAGAASASPVPKHEAATGKGGYRERIVALLTAYAPDRVGNADAMLAKYPGNEEKLIESLVQRLGPEPAATASSSAAVAPATMPPASASVPTPAPPTMPSPAASTHKERLQRFYAKYAPEKVNDVDRLLTKYAGKEDMMFVELVRRYGPEPEAAAGASTSPAVKASPAPAALPSSTSNGYRDRVVALLTAHAPDRVGNADAMLAKYPGNEEQLIATLVQRLGPEPNAPSRGAGGVDDGNETVREWLVRFLTKYTPDRVGNADAMLEKYHGREDVMKQQLVERFGPAPAASATPPASRGSGHDMSPKARLLRFYGRYAPEKVRDADMILDKYTGREEQLFEALVSRYGPEPAADASPAAATTDNSTTAPVAPPAEAAPRSLQPATMASPSAPPPAVEDDAAVDFVDAAPLAAQQRGETSFNLSSFTATLRRHVAGMRPDVCAMIAFVGFHVCTDVTKTSYTVAPDAEAGILPPAYPRQGDDISAGERGAAEFWFKLSKLTADAAAKEQTMARKEHSDREQILALKHADAKRIVDEMQHQHEHAHRVVERALRIIHGVEEQYREETRSIEALERAGLIRWFKQQAQTILIMSPSPQITSVENRLNEWKLLVRRNREQLVDDAVSRRLDGHDPEFEATAARVLKSTSLGMQAARAVAAHSNPPRTSSRSPAASRTATPRGSAMGRRAAEPHHVPAEVMALDLDRVAPHSSRRGIAVSETERSRWSYGTPRSTQFPAGTGGSSRAQSPRAGTPSARVASSRREAQGDTASPASSSRRAGTPAQHKRIWGQHVPTGTCASRTVIDRSGVRGLYQPVRIPRTVPQPFSFSAHLSSGARYDADDSYHAA